MIVEEFEPHMSDARLELALYHCVYVVMGGFYQLWLCNHMCQVASEPSEGSNMSEVMLLSKEFQQAPGGQVFSKV